MKGRKEDTGARVFVVGSGGIQRDSAKSGFLSKQITTHINIDPCTLYLVRLFASFECLCDKGTEKTTVIPTSTTEPADVLQMLEWLFANEKDPRPHSHHRPGCDCRQENNTFSRKAALSWQSQQRGRSLVASRSSL